MDKHWVRRIILFLSGQTITLFGSAIVQFAISWHITLTTQSGLMLMLSTLCGFLPQLLISLFAGVWADRYNRKLLIILADGMIAVCTAVLAVLFMMGHTEIWLLFIVSAVRSLGAGIQTPAVSAFLPQLVPQEHLMRVNGINSSVMSVMMLVSPVAAGGLYAAMGLAPVFWVDVATAVIGICVLLSLKTAPFEKVEREPEHFFSDMTSGFRYVLATKWLRDFLGFYIFFSLTMGPLIFLTPLMVARSFGPEPWRLVAHEMAFSVGCVIGGVLIGLWGGLRNKIHTMIAACTLFGVATFIMGFSPNFWFYLCVMFPMGIVMPFINTIAVTVLQTRTEPDFIGRVFGFVSIIGSATLPLSMAFFGPLADVVSVETQLIVTGAAMALISLFVLRLKEVIEAGAPLPPLENPEPDTALESGD